MKKALITGINGQDGSYLAELLLEKGYEVHGIIRRSSTFNTERIEHLYIESLIKDLHKDKKINLHYGDMTDSTSLIRLVQQIQPDEIYNLAAQSHVRVSFDMPEYTAETDAVGTLRLLEAVRICGLIEKTRIYQASTSELYGGMAENKNTSGLYDEKSPFYPRSPYGVAKLYAYWITVNYREAYNMYACNGILFNHESPQRGETFLTRKVTRAAARIALGLDNCLYLGNLNAQRDWGHAKDYIEGMYLMLQQEKPEDFVLATGITTTIREFVKMTFAELGIELGFKGSGDTEEAYVVKNTGSYNLNEGQVVVKVDPKYYRPTEVDLLIGDPTKAMTKLSWKPKYDLAALVKEMVASDVSLFKKELYIKQSGL